MVGHLQVTSEEVVSAYISRTQEVNPYLNVIVGNRFDAALKEAREVDRILASDNIPEKYSERNAPFLGVPMTTKEAISIEGIASRHWCNFVIVIKISVVIKIVITFKDLYMLCGMVARGHL